MQWNRVGALPCSIARALSVVGDRWTLLILREAFSGIDRFDAFQRHLGIARNVLADRLERLVGHGILERRAYQMRPRRDAYELTKKGRDLYPLLLALMSWGDRHMSGSEGPPVRLVHAVCGKRARGIAVCSECGEPLDSTACRAVAGPGLMRSDSLQKPS